MKSLADIQQDLEAEGFKVIGGRDIAERYTKRVFSRDEGEQNWSLIEVHLFRFDEDDDAEPGEDDEERMPTPEQQKLIFSKLTSRYDYGDILLMVEGFMPLPGWLKEEIKRK